MISSMQNLPLLTSAFIRHANRWHPEVEIVSQNTEGGQFRYTYGRAYQRICKLANALLGLGIQSGDRIATLAWNNHRHFEAYYGISGIGAVTHTINPRYTPEQITYIINHAQDEYVLLDSTFLPLLERVADKCPSVKGYILLANRDQVPAVSNLTNLVSYEDFISDACDEFSWPDLDENITASLCYTSGTTGNPKGVAYSHRSTALHALCASLPDCLGLSKQDSVLPIVPLFHINAWELPYCCAMTGAKLVLPGPNLDGQSLYQLLSDEQVTLSAGVPTLWLGLLNYMNEHNLDLPKLERVGVGGSACPTDTIKQLHEKYSIRAMHGWGMTETSSVVTLNTDYAPADDDLLDEYYAAKAKVGTPIWGSDIKIVDESGAELPRDGKASGELMVKGHWVVNQYYGQDKPCTDDGWFATGDVATIDSQGRMQLTDRLKDIIKSGGEWISSVELEDIATSHPDVAQAAVIGVPHPKWDERPLLVVTCKDNVSVDSPSMQDFFTGKIAKWAIPEATVVVDQLPIGATGKIHKLTLREEYKNFYS
ncbi:3-(methylthio)propionyl-CoA ligase [Maricurvus nonylphenolicus]|uniref:long-chain-fatty-acid--CoA ligase n=1 Tax=Maricurvus nonylphenolicus TaxID=1008307 RepID=UPI0036F29139